MTFQDFVLWATVIVAAIFWAYLLWRVLRPPQKAASPRRPAVPLRSPSVVTSRPDARRPTTSGGSSSRSSARSSSRSDDAGGYIGGGFASGGGDCDSGSSGGGGSCGGGGE